MARRKRQYLDDGDSSEGSKDGEDDFIDGDTDSREERALFEDPYQRKRRRVDGQDGRVDWTKAPAFVAGDTVNPKSVEEEEDNEAGEERDEAEKVVADSGETTSEEDSSEYSTHAPSPRVREEEIEEDRGGLGGRGGLGMRRNVEPPLTPLVNANSRGGIGAASRSTGLGMGVSQDSLPSAFGSAPRTSRPQQAFVRDSGGPSIPRAAPTLSASEKQHFSKLQGSFGARMMAKMGWELGSGLGSEGQGIVTPIESKLRPAKRGIAFGGIKEKTAQSKAEARRRGEVVSDDENTPRAARRAKATDGRADPSDAWKKPKKARIKVKHMTYEEIVGSVDTPTPGIGKIIDATGPTLREVTSLADIATASWTPTSDPMRLPEIRHNLRLLVEASKTDLDGLAREAKAIQERKKWVHNEDTRLRKGVADEAEIIARLQKINLVVENINTSAKEMTTINEPSLDIFGASFEKLATEFPEEYTTYRLDEVVVAAIAPTFRQHLSSWQPLEDPTGLSPFLRRWKNIWKMTLPVEEKISVDIYGATTSVAVQQSTTSMTPYDSLLWNAWLPKVRPCINNDWSPSDPQPVVQLFEAWSDILPPFIRDNFLDQLVIPKIQKAVAEWNPRKEVSLQAIVFPWLPHVGLRMEGFVADARLKVRKLFRSWMVDQGVPKDLLVWKEVFATEDWESMLLKYVVPKLGATLREDFKINPRNQIIEPLNWVFPWQGIIRGSILGQLFETEFFPKWLNVLHIWLIQPNASFEEVAQWYTFWKSAFPEQMLALQGISDGFTRGLQLMNQAIELGPNAPTMLPRPDHPSVKPSKTAPLQASRARPSRATEITFRSIVEDFASSHNLLFIPTGRAHEKSRLPLFRVSPNVEGKSGLLVYILDDAVWAVDGEDPYAITLEDMVLRATKGKK